MGRTTTINKINNFNTPLLMAFERMILGTMITISTELRSTVRGSDIGTEFTITSINEDESVNLLGRINTRPDDCQWKFENVNLKDIIF
jgi:hypothetical protein